MSKESIRKLAKEYKTKSEENPQDRKFALVSVLLNSAVEILEDKQLPDEESRAKREKSNYPSQK